MQQNMEKIKSFEDIGREIGAIVTVKDAAYGDAVGKVEIMIRAAYPNGIPVEQYGNALIIVRMLDKVCRIATDNDPSGEDPFSDIGGYAIKAVEKRLSHNFPNRSIVKKVKVESTEGSEPKIYFINAIDVEAFKKFLESMEVRSV